jgi:hypothetical protein
MRTLLFGVSLLAPLSFAAVLLILAVAVALASFLPACRVSAVNPWTRSEANSRPGRLSPIVNQCDFACAGSVVFPDQRTV